MERRAECCDGDLDSHSSKASSGGPMGSIRTIKGNNINLWEILTKWFGRQFDLVHLAFISGTYQVIAVTVCYNTLWTGQVTAEREEIFFQADTQPPKAPVLILTQINMHPTCIFTDVSFLVVGTEEAVASTFTELWFHNKTLIPKENLNPN